jgi:hypothetical protein
MPIINSRIEAGIYCAEWTGNITTDEMILAGMEARKLIDESGDTYCVSITDMTKALNIPFDASQIRRLTQADTHSIAYVVVKGNIFAKTLSRVLAPLIPKLPIFVETREEALEKAREILQEHTKRLSENEKL